MTPNSTSVLKKIHEEKNKFSTLIKQHKLTLIINANKIGDYCFDSALTAYYNKQTQFSITNERELNKLKLTISNLVSSGKTMLKGNKHNNWR